MNEDFPITIYHNPDCETSRNALAMIHAAGYEPNVVEYLKAGWNRSQLEGLFAAMGVKPRDVLREKGSPAVALGLLSGTIGEDEILDAMIVYPILVNRPIVVTPKGTKLARPSEAVLGVLERKPSSFTKEDGEVVRILQKSG